MLMYFHARCEYSNFSQSSGDYSMRGLTALIVGLMIQTIVVAIEPKIVDEYAERSRTERPFALAVANQELKSLNRYRLEDKAALEKELRERIAALENPLEPYYALGSFDWSELKVGDIGRINNWKAPTERVQEEFDRQRGRRQFPLLEVVQVVSEDAALVKRLGKWSEVPVRKASELKDYELFMARGMSTEGWIDGREAVLDGVFAVTGTETYVSGAGSRTVLLFEKLDLTNHVDKFNCKHESRTWTTKIGKVTDAMYVRHDRGTVTLMDAAGKSTVVELNKLSDEDRKFVRKKIAESKQTKPASR
jgi:hypothetical protein